MAGEAGCGYKIKLMCILVIDYKEKILRLVVAVVVRLEKVRLIEMILAEDRKLIMFDQCNFFNKSIIFTGGATRTGGGRSGYRKKFI